MFQCVKGVVEFSFIYFNMQGEKIRMDYFPIESSMNAKHAFFSSFGSMKLFTFPVQNNYLDNMDIKVNHCLCVEIKRGVYQKKNKMFYIIMKPLFITVYLNQLGF